MSILLIVALVVIFIGLLLYKALISEPGRPRPAIRDSIIAVVQIIVGLWQEILAIFARDRSIPWHTRAAAAINTLLAVGLIGVMCSLFLGDGGYNFKERLVLLGVSFFFFLLVLDICIRNVWIPPRRSGGRGGA